MLVDSIKVQRGFLIIRNHTAHHQACLLALKLKIFVFGAELCVDIWAIKRQECCSLAASGAFDIRLDISWTGLETLWSGRTNLFRNLIEIYLINIGHLFLDTCFSILVLQVLCPACCRYFPSDFNQWLINRLLQRHTWNTQEKCFLRTGTEKHWSKQTGSL